MAGRLMAGVDPVVDPTLAAVIHAVQAEAGKQDKSILKGRSKNVPPISEP
jgi:hypothetical protein